MGHASSTERLDVWRDLIRDQFVALDIAADRHDAFTGHVRSHDIGHLNAARVESVEQVFTRTAELAGADDEAYLQVGLLTRGDGIVSQDGREAVLAPGDFAVYETDRPFRWSLKYDWELLVFTWPRSAVQLPDTATHALTARCLSGTDGLGAIVGGMLQRLVAQPPTLSVDGGFRLSSQIAELVTTAAGEHLEDVVATRTTRSLLQDIDRYIIERLGDPGLGPTDIAAAHFISTRHLHRLFAGRGNSVAQQVQQLRLQRARLDLRNPGYASRSITEIAHRWGFVDLPAFSRAFRSAYGTTPTQFRSAQTTRSSTRSTSGEPARHRPAADSPGRSGARHPAPLSGRGNSPSTGSRSHRSHPRDPRLPIGQYDTADHWPVLTAEAAPRLDPERWTLTIDGLVNNPRTWTWDDLHQLPQSSYQGDIHGATTWSKLGTRFGGVSLDVLFDAVDLQPHAAFLLSTSTTGYTTNLPLSHVIGGQAWIVWTHDGKPLPREHGGPARLLVPHLYLWKSAKWIAELTLLEEDQPGFRERNGYHDLGDPWREQRYQGD